MGDLTLAPYVVVQGTTFDGTGALIATSIELLDRRINPGAQHPLEITGVTADCAPPCNAFTIEGQRVITSPRTIFRNGNATDLLDNRKVEIEGIIDALGQLVASKIAFVKGSVQIEGLADGPADLPAQTFGMLGIAVKVNSVTQLKDGVNLTNINTGSPLKILGYRIGEAQIIASQIGLASSTSNPTRLQGPLQTVNKAASTFTIMSVLITSDRATVFRDINGNAIGLDTFFDTTPSGAIVGVKGVETPDNQLDATSARGGEVEIKD